MHIGSFNNNLIMSIAGEFENMTIVNLKKKTVYFKVSKKYYYCEYYYIRDNFIISGLYIININKLCL